MDKFYGGGGVESIARRHAHAGQACVANTDCSDLAMGSREAKPGTVRPASTPYDSEQGPPDWDYFTEHDYAELAGGF